MGKFIITLGWVGLYFMAGLTAGAEEKELGLFDGVGLSSFVSPARSPLEGEASLAEKDFFREFESSFFPDLQDLLGGPPLPFTSAEAAFLYEYSPPDAHGAAAPLPPPSLAKRMSAAVKEKHRKASEERRRRETRYVQQLKRWAWDNRNLAAQIKRIEKRELPDQTCLWAQLTELRALKKSLNKTDPNSPTFWEVESEIRVVQPKLSRLTRKFLVNLYKQEAKSREDNVAVVPGSNVPLSARK